MLSERQIAANRENAKRSTGPRTAEGKEVVSGNAIKHGLTAGKRVVIMDESAEQFERMHGALQAETVTGTELERGLIDEVAAAMWRLRRAARIERDMMEDDIREALREDRYAKNRQEEHIAGLIEEGKDELAALFRGQQSDPDDPLLAKVLLGEQIRKRLIKDDAYAKLGRYEVQLRRGLYQAVRELRMLRTQHLRNLSQSPPTPRRPAGAGRPEPATSIDAPPPTDTTFATDKAAGTSVAPVKSRQKADKAKKAKKTKKVKKVAKVEAAEKVEEVEESSKSAKPSPEPRKGLGPRCGRDGRIVRSRHEGATSEMVLPDGSVVRIS